MSKAGHPAPAFSHEALFYAGEREFVDGTAAFIRDGLDRDEPILAVIAAHKIAWLRAELGGDADRVHFADMARVGTNPARIIPAWQDFVSAHLSDGRPVRGVGEPIWAERTPHELVECQRHESLLNLAFADTPAWTLLCPYDTSALGDSVIEEALRSHPQVVHHGIRTLSDRYRGLDAIAAPFDVPLPEPPSAPDELHFDLDSLAEGREFVHARAVAAGLGPARTIDLVLAANEVISNSILHGGGHGVLRIWQDLDTLVCEVEDHGRIDEPLVGRKRPDPERGSGRGLWMANQLCDLVQLRTFPSGSIVRLLMRRG